MWMDSRQKFLTRRKILGLGLVMAYDVLGKFAQRREVYCCGTHGVLWTSKWDQSHYLVNRARYRLNSGAVSKGILKKAIPGKWVPSDIFGCQVFLQKSWHITFYLITFFYVRQHLKLSWKIFCIFFTPFGHPLSQNFSCLESIHIV